ncbi:MAG: hypothetical protein AB8G96_14025 [Phycisphaerales bacterium]
MNAFPPSTPGDRPDQPSGGHLPPADPALAAALDRAFTAIPARPGLESRIAASALVARAEALADERLAVRLDAELVPSHVIPADLEDAVHAASVGDLPGRTLAFPSATPSMRRAEGDGSRRGGSGLWFGRLAMAAAFGVVTFAGIWTAMGFNGSGSSPGETDIVMIDPNTEVPGTPEAVETPATSRPGASAALVSFDLDASLFGERDPRSIVDEARDDYRRSVTAALKLDSLDGVTAELTEAMPDAFSFSME